MIKVNWTLQTDVCVFTIYLQILSINPKKRRCWLALEFEGEAFEGGFEARWNISILKVI